MSFISYFRSRKLKPKHPDNLHFIITIHFGMWDCDSLEVANHRILAWTVKHSILKYDFQMFDEIKFGELTDKHPAPYPFAYNSDQGKWKMIISYQGL
ncbi:hypothetical protein [Stenotrophomonas phage RAS14]